MPEYTLSLFPMNMFRNILRTWKLIRNKMTIFFLQLNKKDREEASRPLTGRYLQCCLTTVPPPSDRIVYRLPDDQFCHQLSPRSKKKADRLRLPPEQEYMRSAIGRSLASSSSSAPKSRMANFMEKVILGKKH